MSTDHALDPARAAGPARGLLRKRRRWRAQPAARPVSGAPQPVRLARLPASPPAIPLPPLMAEYTAIYGTTWSRATRRKHADDFARFLAWLEANGHPRTTDAFAYSVLVEFVEHLRTRPRMTSAARFHPEALARPGGAGMLSANSVNAYVRPLRSLAIWFVDEGILVANPFRRSRRRSSLNPLLPSEETPTKGATLEDLRALERGCNGEAPLDLRDRAIVALLVTTAARNSSVRLLRVPDVDFERSLIVYRKAKGGKTLAVALHPDARRALEAYLIGGRPALLAAAHAAGRPGCVDDGILFPSAAAGGLRPLGTSALSLMLTRRYHAGGGTIRSFGSHRIRHGAATLLVNNGMPLEEVSRYLGHSSSQVTRRYAQATPAALGERAAEAFARAGVAGVTEA